MLSKTFKSVQYLSLDIVIGAVILLRFFSTQYSVYIDGYVYFLLAAAVWVIYTVDHLNDARKANGPSRERYLFHLRHQRSLKIAIAIVMMIALVMITKVEQVVIIGGLAIGFLCLIYLMLQSWLAKVGLKEVYIAIVYTTGIFLVPFLHTGLFDFFPYFMLFLMAITNLWIFSWIEIAEDRADNFQSIATQLGDLKTGRVILITLSLGLALSLSSLLSSPVFGSYCMIAFSIFCVIFLKAKWARVREKYRYIGDGVFILPILFEIV